VDIAMMANADRTGVVTGSLWTICRRCHHKYQQLVGMSSLLDPTDASEILLSGSLSRALKTADPALSTFKKPSPKLALKKKNEEYPHSKYCRPGRGC
jgi:hypothetical protein